MKSSAAKKEDLLRLSVAGLLYEKAANGPER